MLYNNTEEVKGYELKVNNNKPFVQKKDYEIKEGVPQYFEPDELGNLQDDVKNLQDGVENLQDGVENLQDVTKTIKRLDEEILEFCKEPKSLIDICKKFGYKDTRSFKQNHISILMEKNY